MNIVDLSEWLLFKSWLRSLSLSQRSEIISKISKHPQLFSSLLKLLKLKYQLHYHLAPGRQLGKQIITLEKELLNQQ